MLEKSVSVIIGECSLNLIRQILWTLNERQASSWLEAISGKGLIIFSVSCYLKWKQTFTVHQYFAYHFFQCQLVISEFHPIWNSCSAIHSLLIDSFPKLTPTIANLLSRHDVSHNSGAIVLPTEIWEDCVSVVKAQSFLFTRLTFSNLSSDDRLILRNQHVISNLLPVF